MICSGDRGPDGTEPGAPDGPVGGMPGCCGYPGCGPTGGWLGFQPGCGPYVTRRDATAASRRTGLFRPDRLNGVLVVDRAALDIAVDQRFVFALAGQVQQEEPGEQGADDALGFAFALAVEE